MEPEIERIWDVLEMGTLAIFEYAFELAHAAIEALWRLS